MSNTSFPKAENENGNGERRGTNTPIMAGGPVGKRSTPYRSNERAAKGRAEPSQYHIDRSVRR